MERLEALISERVADAQRSLRERRGTQGLPWLKPQSRGCAWASVDDQTIIAARLSKARVRLKEMTLFNSSARRIARIDIASLRSSVVLEDVEIARMAVPRDFFMRKCQRWRGAPRRRHDLTTPRAQARDQNKTKR